MAKIIKASFKDCPIDDRRLFKQSHCLMPISVGQPVHEGDKFKAIINLVNNNFKKCTILIDDTIQRYTLRILDENLLDQDAFAKALKEGDLWLERNKNIYEQLTIPCSIIRWNKWLFHDNFSQRYFEIKSFYLQNKDYKNAIDLNIKEFLERYLLKGIISSSAYEQSFTLCLDYLLEECTAMTLWSEGNYNFELYPTGRNKAMAATYEAFIQPKYPHLLKSVGIRFKKY